MKISELKKGFWGYSKESVYRYISVLNEEFSKKLLEKDEKSEEVIRELKEKNAGLNAELEMLKKETEEYRKRQVLVSNSIIEAQNYAEKLKTERQKKEQLLCAQIEEQIAKARCRTESYMAEVDDFRKRLKTMLEKVDASVEETQYHAQALIKKAAAETDETRRMADSYDYDTEQPPAPTEEKKMFAPDAEQAYKSDTPISNLSLFGKRIGR